MSKRVLSKSAGKSGGETLAKRKPKLTPNQKAMKDAGTGVPKVGEVSKEINKVKKKIDTCLLYTSPSPRDGLLSRMPSSA